MHVCIYIYNLAASLLIDWLMYTFSLFSVTGNWRSKREQKRFKKKWIYLGACVSCAARTRARKRRGERKEAGKCEREGGDTWRNERGVIRCHTQEWGRGMEWLEEHRFRRRETAANWRQRNFVKIFCFWMLQIRVWSTLSIKVRFLISVVFSIFSFFQ